MSAPLRAMGGEIDVRPIDRIGGLQLVYRGPTHRPVPILLSRTQAAALADVLRAWIDPEDLAR